MSWLISRALMDRYASLHCSQEQAAEYSEESCSAGEPSVPSSTTPTPQAYLSRDKTTEAWSRFPSGMTCAPLTENRGEELLTWYRAAFRARTFQPQVKASASTASVADSGVKWPASLAKYDRVSRSWRTRQCLLFEDSAEFSETFPRWGTMRDGELFRQPTPSGLLAIRAWITSAIACGLQQRVPTPTVQDKCRDVHNQRDGSKRESLLGFVRRVPTPTATDGHKWNAKTKQHRKAQGSSVRICNEDRGDGNPIGGQLNPPWVEWLQGFPIEWTVLDVSATPKFQLWRRSHGRSLRVAMERILES